MNASDWIAISGIIVQVVLGGLALCAAFTWHREYIGRRKLEAAVNVVFWARRFVKAVSDEMNAWMVFDQDHIHEDLEQLEILRRGSTSSDDAMKELNAAWGRAEIDLDEDLLRRTIGPLSACHWNWRMMQARPYDGFAGRRDSQLKKLEVAEQLIDDAHVPLTR